jgi:hypothetical protein
MFVLPEVSRAAYPIGIWGREKPAFGPIRVGHDDVDIVSSTTVGVGNTQSGH